MIVGQKDHQRYVFLHHQRIPIKPPGAGGPRREASQEQGEGRLCQTVRGLRHARLRLDEGG